MNDRSPSDGDGSRGAQARLGWRVAPLAVVAVLVASLLFDVGPHVVRRGQTAVGPIYWATTLGYGALLGLLWAGADRLLRGRLRAAGWALAMGSAALLFSPDGVLYFGNAFAFGGELALQGLQAMWPTAVGSAALGLALGCAARRGPLPRLAVGLGAGMLGRALGLALAAEAPPMGVVAWAVLRAGVEGALLGLSAALALREAS